MTDTSERVRGALGNIDATKVVAAARLVEHGVVVPLNLPISVHIPQRPGPVRHMLDQHTVREVGGGRYVLVNDDAVTLSLQGSSHWDSLAHIGVIQPGSPHVYHGERSLQETASQPGTAASLGIEMFDGGVVSRGVLLDAVRVLGEPGARWLPDDLRMGPADVERCIAASGVELGRGDIAVLYTGFEDRMDEEGRWVPQGAGLDGSTAPMWRDLGVAAIVSDNVGVEALPPDYRIHMEVLCEAGIPLGELWALRQLADTARQLDRFEFLLVSVPLNLPGAFGSPANAVAVF